VALLPPIFQQNNQYSARVTRQLIDDIATEGVVGAGHFAVTQRAAGAAMSVEVSAGRAYITGDDQANQGRYLCVSETTEELLVAAADTTDPRIDLVVAEVRDPNAGGASGDDWQFRIIEGTPDVSPVAPAVPDSAIALAEIEVDANVTSILDADITDLRTFAENPLAPQPGGFQYAGTRYYTSSGTFLKADPLETGDIGLKAIRVRCVGGGGGGGSATAGTNESRSGGGGHGGGFAERFILASELDSSETVVRGAGGSAGNNGARSSFSTVAETYFTDAVGGTSGLSGADTLPSATSSVGITRQSPNQTGGAGDLVGDPEVGGIGVSTRNVNTASGGHGGPSVFGTGGRGAFAISGAANGFDGVTFGSGGSGGCAVNSGTGTGGSGANGIVIIDCFV